MPDETFDTLMVFPKQFYEKGSFFCVCFLFFFFGGGGGGGGAVGGGGNQDTTQKHN